MKKVISIVGARPQFVKEALLGAYACRSSAWEHILVHSGQHYDVNMSDIFFSELHISPPKYFLGVGSGTHGVMTAAILKSAEEVLLAEKPAALIVYGDTNTTLAGALAAAKLQIPIIHVEAGIRMQPSTMPEEINRIVTDRISSVLCCCSCFSKQNLAHEGIVTGVHVTGDIMYDVFLTMKQHFISDYICTKYQVDNEKFIVLTLHRDYNVDDKCTLYTLLQGLCAVQRNINIPMVWPMHPRTKKKIAEFGYDRLIKSFTIIEPLGYIELMSLVCASCFVITDSGGLQKEAYYAGKRSVVLMPDSGWQELIDIGWNILSPPHAATLENDSHSIVEKCDYPYNIYGDGTAVQKIAKEITQIL